MLKKTLISILFAASLVPFVAQASPSADAAYKTIHVQDLSAWLAQDPKSVHVYDANNEDTRKKYGVIPGATRLASYKDYALSTLPKDHAAKLVFYCASVRCSASHSAAERAFKNGYTDVSVLADGIKGWTEAGQKTVK